MSGKIVFDLDGTLWETGDAYIYSYNKTCVQLNIPKENIQNDDYVLSYLGIPLEELVQTIIPEAEDKIQLGKMLLTNVIEYLLNNPKTYSQNIMSLFSGLSKEYKLYIISNCPKPFLDTFYEVSGVKQFVSDSYTREDCCKTEALRIITHDYSEKTLFVGDAVSDYESIENHNCIQFVYASYGYVKCPEYNLYLEQLDDLPNLLCQIKNMYSVLKNDDFQILSHNHSSVTMMPKKDSMYFGFINADKKEDFDYIIPQMKKLCSNKKLFGPINKNTWYEYRIALNEFDFNLYPDSLCNKDLLDVFLKNGFSVYEEYTSTVTKANIEEWKKKKSRIKNIDYEWKVVKGNECINYIETIYEISCRCFSDHAFYEEIELSNFTEMYKKLLVNCSPVLILILYKGKTVGFNFCYPDPEKRFFVDKTIALDKKHRNSFTLYKIIELTHKEIENLGYTEILFHYQNINLRTMQSYFDGTIVRQKKYGVLKYEYSK